MKEIEYGISALHYIAEHPDEYSIILAKFIMQQHIHGDWTYGIRCTCYEGSLLFIG